MILKSLRISCDEFFPETEACIHLKQIFHAGSSFSVKIYNTENSLLLLCTACTIIKLKVNCLYCWEKSDFITSLNLSSLGCEEFIVKAVSVKGFFFVLNTLRTTPSEFTFW